MTISSPAFLHNEKMPAEYTCDGANISPGIKVSGAPDNAKGLVLIVDDPDAPMGTWVHWLVWNIEPTTGEIPAGALACGVEGITSFGSTGYGGPCPPSGTHRYFFKLYALDTFLELDKSAGKHELEQAMEGHILDRAELIGLYFQASE